MITETEGFEAAGEMIVYVEKVNQMYQDGISHLDMARTSVQEGAGTDKDSDGAEHLRKYQDKFLDAIEKIKERKIRDYKLKKALQQG